MLMEGQAIRVQAVEEGIHEIIFDLKGDVINKLSQLTLQELREAVSKIKATDGVTGVLFQQRQRVLYCGC